MPEIHNRLTIYRFPTMASNSSKYFPLGGNYFFDRTRLAEEIYSWATTVPIWNGIQDTEKRVNVQNMLTEFNGTGQVGRESVADLWLVLSELEAVARDDNWVGANSVRSIGGSEEFEAELRILPALTFAHHLRWICETFGQTQDLVVIYR